MKITINDLNTALKVLDRVIIDHEYMSENHQIKSIRERSKDKVAILKAARNIVAGMPISLEGDFND